MNQERPDMILLDTPRAPRPAQRVADVRAYQPPAAALPTDLKLDANEGPPTDPAVLDAIRALTPEQLTRYPNPADLERDIAALWNIDPSRIVVTNGADDAIDRLCRATLEPGRECIIHAPTFEMIPRSARLAGASITQIDWLDTDFPLDAFLNAITESTALVALVSPNNPTGSTITLTQIQRIAARAAEAGATVLVDLAYIEFADTDPTPQLLDIDNLVITRTFSKALGLAGLRIGYAIAPSQTAAWIRTAGAPYPVSAPSSAAARAALQLQSDTQIQSIRARRDQLQILLRSLGASPIESQANFITARFADAPFTRSALESQGIAVRAFPSDPALADYLRITIPTNQQDFDRLTAALRSALAPEAILLDMDGVIADVSRSYRRAIIETAAAFAVDITPQDISRAKRLANANNDWILTQQLIAQGGIDAPLDKVTAVFQRLYLGDDFTPGLESAETLIPSAPLLRRLAARTKLAIVTGRPRAEARRFLRRFNIEALFPVLVCMEDAPAKPSPEPVRFALEQLRVKSAWLVGDTPDDINAARAARAVPMAIPAPGESDAQASFTGAARTLQSLSELEDLLP